MNALIGRQDSDRQRLLVPFSNPVIPPIPEDFRALKDIGLDPEQGIFHALYGAGGFSMNFSVNLAGAKKASNVLAGHKLGADGSNIPFGPTPADVMIVGKMVSYTELSNRRLFSEEYGDIVIEALEEAGIKSDTYKDFYVTNILKTPPLEGGNKFPKLWVQNQLILFWQELLLVKPKFVLLLGNDVIKAVLGTKFSLKNLEGATHTQAYNLADSEESQPLMHEVTFMAASSPGAVMAERSRPTAPGVVRLRPHGEKRFFNNVRSFASVIQGNAPAKEVSIDWTLVETEEQLIEQLTLMRKEAVDGLVAWDGEWQGAHPQNNDAYLRCIQFAWKPLHGVVIALTHPGGKPRFKYKTKGGKVTTDGGTRRACELCKQYMEGLRVVGHYFMADLEFFIPNGLDLRQEYDAAPSWQEAKAGKGGVATELMAHAWDETALFSLDEQILARLDLPKYSDELKEYRKAEGAKLLTWANAEISKTKKIYSLVRSARRKLTNAQAKWLRKPTEQAYALVKEYEQELDALQSEIPMHEQRRREIITERNAKQKELSSGYGWIPDEILYPYGAWDVAAELQLAHFYIKNLHSDRFGNDCWEAYWVAHRATLPLLEVNTTGLLVDREQVDYFAKVFTEARDRLLAEVRAYMNWPTFNPRSSFEVAEMLFGERYNGYLQRYGKMKRCRPMGAKTLRCEPLRTTDEYPIEWEQVRAEGREHFHSVSTDKQTLGEMAAMKGDLKVRYFDKEDRTWKVTTRDYSDIIGKFRDFRYIDQALKGMLRNPERDSYGNFVTDDEGQLEYDDGIIEYMCDDGRVRTRMSQTLKTGRNASMNPNLQNQVTSRQDDYIRIIGRQKLSTSLKAMFTAPKDHFIVSCDYTGAELLIMAILAQDEKMIDHCIRNNLPDDHPDKMDIHSNLTVKAFKLDCEPTKAGLKSIGKAKLRNLGKGVVFGSAYGRGAKAVAVAARMEGTFATEEEARIVQQEFFATYPKLQEFFNATHSRVKVGWLKNMFGAYRRFPVTNNDKLFKQLCREAQNSPIQGAVAYALNIAERNIYDYRNRTGMRFKILLPIHDAIMLEVPADELLHVIDEENGVYKKCMVDGVPLYPTDLLGNRIPIKEPYKFGIEMDIYGRWGEVATPDRFIPNGLDPSIVGWKFNGEHWVWKDTDTFIDRKWDSHGNEV